MKTIKEQLNELGELKKQELLKTYPWLEMMDEKSEMVSLDELDAITGRKK